MLNGVPVSLLSACFLTLIHSHEQLRLASVRVVEAISVWRQDAQAADVKSRSSTLGQGDLQKPQALSKTSATDRKETQASLFADEPQPGVLSRSLESGQQEAGDIPASTTTVDLQCCSRDEAREFDSPDSPQTIAVEPRREQKLTGSSGESRNAAGTGGGDGRVAKGRWVVTMMVPGRKLWESSPAMVSQYKRFRRSRQEPKIARDQVRYRARC